MTEEAEFQAKQLHQKVKVTGWTSSTPARMCAHAGERPARAERKSFRQRFTEAVPFKLLLRLQRNPNMVQKRQVSHRGKRLQI